MKNNNVIILFAAFVLATCSASTAQISSSYKDNELIKMHKSVLYDKIRGGWAGQVIGVTYGGPTEFKWQGSIIDDMLPIPWDEHQMLWWYENSPGLYDDLYMDLTFVEVFEKHGLDAPAELHAKAFANADYLLWHANQAARYNILQGIMPPESGHWKNNPHADDIDFQIEADFAGLMSPGMINTASEISDKIGHIMNYGDGWYGGVFVAGMYTQAFVSEDIQFVIKEALKAIPEQSRFYKTIADVISWHEMYPNDWKKTWLEVQRKWSFDKGCPSGVFNQFNIEANLNSSWIVLGLLYGNGDYGKTIDISTRAGDDSDCNPSNAAGILGTMIGYSNIPDYWKQGLDKVEDIDFAYTTMSLNDVYEIGFKHAIETIERNGGNLADDEVEIAYQTVKPVKLEVAFEGIYPFKRLFERQSNRLDQETPVFEFEFEGVGLVINGGAIKQDELPDYELKMDVHINGDFVETVIMPTNYNHRKLELYFNYDLTEKNNQIKLMANDIPEGYNINVSNVLIYSRNDPGPQTY
jgi:hypothetical protein